MGWVPCRLRSQGTPAAVRAPAVDAAAHAVCQARQYVLAWALLGKAAEGVC